MDFKDEFLATFVIRSTSEYITLLACSYLWSHRVYCSLLRKGFECERIIAMVTKSVSIIYKTVSADSFKTTYILHSVIVILIQILQVRLWIWKRFLIEVWQVV